MATTAISKGIKHRKSPTRLGYHEHESSETRHRALGKAVKKYGYKKTQDKLVALEVLNKHTHPEFSATVRADSNFLRREYRGSSLRS